MKSKADAVSKAKTDFLSRMSHEIRTPMNAISGMTTIAKKVLDDRDKTLSCLEKIESANAYLLDLINDILDMSRIESGKMELNSLSLIHIWNTTTTCPAALPWNRWMNRSVLLFMRCMGASIRVRAPDVYKRQWGLCSV